MTKHDYFMWARRPIFSLPRRVRWEGGENEKQRAALDQEMKSIMDRRDMSNERENKSKTHNFRRTLLPTDLNMINRTASR